MSTKKRRFVIIFCMFMTEILTACRDSDSNIQITEIVQETSSTSESSESSSESEIDEEEYKHQCKIVEYKKYFRNDKEYIGDKIKVDILVKQVMEGNYRGYDISGNEYYIVDLCEYDHPFRIMENDSLTIYGEFSGVQSITRAIGDYQADIFCINAKYIDLHEDGETFALNSNDAEDSDIDIFAMSAGRYYFSSGVGAWATLLDLKADGMFVGYYSDEDMASENQYDAIIYQSSFHGQFKNPVKVNYYTYKVKLDNEVMIDSSNDRFIDQRILYINTEPYGMEVGKEFYIYLPGAPISELPEPFINWIYDPGEFLTSYGIYNIEGGYGFIRERTDYNEESSFLIQNETYIFPDSDIRLLTDYDLYGLSADILRIAKNEIYARHGRIFLSEDLKSYFESQSWYRGTIPPNQFNENVFNQIEKKNILFIQKYIDSFSAADSY